MFQETYEAQIQTGNPGVPVSKLRMLVAAKWRLLGQGAQGDKGGLGASQNKGDRPNPKGADARDSWGRPVEPSHHLNKKTMQQNLSTTIKGKRPGDPNPAPATRKKKRSWAFILQRGDQGGKVCKRSRPAIWRTKNQELQTR